MKKKFLLLAVLPLLITGCGDSSGQTGGNTTGGDVSSQQLVTKYTVTFANTSMPSVQIEEGKSLTKPTDPVKANNLFIGWYLDSQFTNEVTFPLTITQDTTIYAKFYSYQEAFQKARNNTIGNQVAGYEYDYELNVSASYMGLALTGSTTGNSKYSSRSTDVKFYDVHVNSGALFYDGSKYSIRKGRELHEISLNEDEVIRKYKITEVGDEYTYDSSSFAKAIFEYDDTKIHDISKTTVANEYKLNTGFNASAGIALIGNYVNHPMVEKIVGELPETSVNTNMYVTFSGDKLNTYKYEMNINVSGVQFSLIYNLTFKNIGVAPTITPKVFNNTYVSNSDFTNAKTEIVSYINSYKALEHSSYDFKVKTAVDYAKKNAINATVDGSTKRKVVGGKSFYLNDYEVDTDHKNADLYKDKGLDDCHGARVKLSNGEVHDLKKKLIGGYNDLGVVSHETIDDYYLLDVLEMIPNITFIQKNVDTKKGTTTYSIGADTASAINVLKSFNNALRLNPLGECSTDVKAFGSFVDSSITIKTFEFEIVIANGALSEINLKMNGKLAASFPQSRDFNSVADAGFKLDYTLTVTTKGNDYEPASSADKVK